MSFLSQYVHKIGKRVSGAHLKPLTLVDFHFKKIEVCNITKLQESPKAIRMEENKTCNKCNIEQPISNFQFRKDSGKHRNACKKCVNEHAVEYNKRYVPGAKERMDEHYKQPVKTCKECEIEKDVEEFAVRSDTGKRRNQCILCRNAYVAEFKRTEESKAVQRARSNEIYSTTSRVVCDLLSKKLFINGASRKAVTQWISLDVLLMNSEHTSKSSSKETCLGRRGTLNWITLFRVRISI